MSAAEELERMFGLFPDDEPCPESSHERADPGPSASTSESVPRFQSQADIPIHSSHSLATHPEGSEASPWAQGTAETISESHQSTSESAAESVAPAVVMSQPPKSATEALLDMVDMSFTAPTHEVADSLSKDDTQEMQHTTVSLADITRQDEPDHRNIPPIPPLLTQEPSQEAVSAKLDELIVASPQADQSLSEHDSPESVISHHPLAPEYRVTLPFQASLRPLYDSILVDYKRPITDFSNAFINEIYTEPKETLVNKIDELVGRLHNICDYPQGVSGTALEELPPQDIAKYCCDANSKFSFIFELLQNLQNSTKILIIARSRELLRLIHHLTNTLQIQCSSDALGIIKGDYEDSTVHVNLALSSEEIDASGFDAVIGFDSSFNTSKLIKQQPPSPDDGTKQQLIMVLLTTNSIEHIDLRISDEPEELTPMERRNVLIAAIVRARKLLNDPERDYLEPHEVATVFCEYLNGQADTISWDSQAIPDDVFDVYFSSQARSQMPISPPQEQENGRKRKLDSSEDSEVKRIRVFPTRDLQDDVHQPPVPEEVRELLNAAMLNQQSSRPDVFVRVPLSALEVLAEQMFEYQRRSKDDNLEAEYKATISNLESQVKEYERTTHKIYESNRAALQDRSRYEEEARKAEAAQKAAVESAEKQAEGLRKSITELEETVARLTQDPSSSDPEDTPLARSEKLLQEALSKARVAEKRLENSNSDESYIRNAYQDASSAAAQMKGQLSVLKAENEDLSQKASENAVRIHQIQANNTVSIYVRQIEELKAQVRDRESELDRTREELRQIKNGRRETRGVSVPRSPRMGVMSPRIGGRAFGSASRGTSPAPAVAPAGADGTAQLQQRWNHLRD